MAGTRYLKNVWAKKDADGDYWLFIDGGGLEAAFCLSRKQESDEDSVTRRALQAWLAEQNKSNGDSNKSVRSN